jgi:aspartate/methionine/tyrosine aminotransferase
MPLRYRYRDEAPFTASVRPPFPLAALLLGDLRDPMAAIREHNLKRFFGELPARVDVDASHSYAQGATTQELLDLEPGAQEQLLSQSLAHYTDDFGRGRLAAAIAALYKGVAPEDVFVLSGTDAVIFDVFAALTNPNTTAVVQSPEYPPLRNVAEWRGASVVSWGPEADGSWDLAATADADMVVCCVPHSPLATSPSEEWLRTLAGRCEVQGRTLIVDEIYRGIDLTEDGSGVLPSACELSSKAVRLLQPQVAPEPEPDQFIVHVLSWSLA